jgi:hypothetical protein
MGLLFIRLVILFAALIVAYIVWDKVIHPLLFKEEIDEKLESAAETKIKRKVDKEVQNILKEED